MTLNQITKVKGPGIHTQANIVSNTISLGGIATASNFKTGTSNLHNIGLEIAGINVLGADTPIGTGATIYNSGNAIYAGVVTATKFVGQVDITGGSASFSGNVSIGGTLTYEDVTNIDSVGIITARDGLKVLAGGANVVGVVTASAGIKDGTLTSGRVVYAGAGGKLSDDADLTYDGTTLSATGAVSLAGPIVLQPGGTAWSTTNNRPQIKREADGELRLGAGSDSSSIVTFYTSPSSGGTLVKRLHISANGKVGVGADPSAYPGKFVVSGDALICDRDIHSRVASSIANSDRGFKQDTDGVEKLHLYADNSNNIILEGNGGAEKLRINNGGSVGIGTVDPDSKLHVHSGAVRVTNTTKTNVVELSTDGNIEIRRTGGSAYIDFADNTTNDADCRIQHVSDGFEFSTGGQGSRTLKLLINSAGKVAIGNGSPQQLLHVWPDTANTTSAYVRVTAGDRNSNTGIDIGQDASGDGHVNVVSNGTLSLSTNNAPRIKISNSSAATSIGGAMTFNALLTTQGDVSGGLLLLKAAENTSRFFVSGNDSSSCEVNLYDANGTQQVVLGTSTGAAWLSQVQNNYFSFKTNNTERVRIWADGGTHLTRRTNGGAETVGNDPGKWFKIGTWAGSTVDAAARATITVIGAATHDSNSNVSGETKIHLSFSSNPTLFGYFYSTTATRQGVAGVAHKYNSGTKSAEIWIKYEEGYSSTACYADVTNGFFTGDNTNTGSTSTPSGATLLESWWSVWTSNQTTSSRKLEVDAGGAFKHSPLGSFNSPYLKAEGNSSTYIQKIQKNGSVDTNLSFRVQDGGSLAQLLYLKGSNKTVAIGPDITPVRNLHVQEHFVVANKGTNSGQPYVSSTPILAVTTDGSNVVPADTTYRHNALVSFGVGGHNGGNPGSNALPGLGYFKLDLYGQTGLGDVGTNLDSTLSIRSINPNNTRLRIRTKDNYNGTYPDASISFTQQQSTEIARIECDTETGAANQADLVFYTNFGGLYERLRIDKQGKISLGAVNTSHIKMDGTHNRFRIQTEDKDAVFITQSQVLSAAKVETKCVQYSSVNTKYFSNHNIKQFSMVYYTGASSATYHVARFISQTDWGFDNITFQIGKYQYNPTSDDLQTQRCYTYYGGHTKHVVNYNQYAGGTGTGNWNVLHWQQNFGPGGAHQIHTASNGGYYRDCWGSDLYINLGVYTGIKLLVTVWANTGLHDTGDYATAYDYYPANFGGTATQTNADNWSVGRGVWFNTTAQGTGTGSAHGVLDFSTGDNYGETSST